MYDENTEKIFRENELKLDGFLLSASDYLNELGITIKDASNRVRLGVGHEYNRLWWGAFFDKNWVNGSNRLFASLRLSCMEPGNKSEPIVIYSTLYFGSGSAIDLSSRVLSNEVECIKIPGISVDDIDKMKFTVFIKSKIDQAVKAQNQKL